jgi:MFS family permease
MRSFGLTISQTGQFFGALLLTGGVAGILFGGWLGDRLGARNRRWYALAPALCYVAGTPLFIAGVLSGSWQAAFALFVLPQALVYVWLGPVLTAVQHLVPAHMRATASASFLLINNLIGLGLGSWVIGALSDHLAPSYGTQALRYAIAAGLCLYLVAGALMAIASTRLKRDWVD